MGARSNIELKYKEGSVFIYSHWDSNAGMATKLKAALRRKWRWDDPQYLGRIIFCEVVGKQAETGFGLAPYPGEEGYPTIVVDMDDQKVDGVPFEKYIK